jgi:Zn-dependent protease with chaperone function
MSPDQQDALISELEEAERKSPSRFATRVAWMAMLGYTVLMVVLALLLGSAAGVIQLAIRVPNAGTLKLAIIVALVALLSAWSIVRSLWVRLDPPRGLVVTAKDAPLLFEELKRLRALLRVRPITKVLLSPDLNAAACEVPRLGIFGWPRRYLELGLPLLQALSPEELRSVIAHEIGHLSREHNGITRWLYRVRITWLNLVSSAAAEGRGFSMLSPFLRWWWPRFNAHAFVLSRRQEHEADAAAARAAGPVVAGTALLRLDIVTRLLEEDFWPGIHHLAAEIPLPPQNLHEQLAQTVRLDPGPEALRWLREALAVPTNNADTHPCLRERLVQMGFPGAEDPDSIPVPSVIASSAAEVFLGEFEQIASRRFSEDWARDLLEPWKQRHADAAQRREALERTNAAVAAGTLTTEQRWERISHVADVQGDDAVLPLVTELLEREPVHAAANFLMGRILLDRDDPKGIEFLEKAMVRDSFATPDACGVIYGYLQRKGRLAEAKAVERRIYEHEQLVEQAQEERANVNAKSVLLPHGLSDADLAAIREVLVTYPEIAQTSIARAEVKLLPENPYFLVALTIQVPWWTFRNDEADEVLVNTLAGKLPVPGQFFIFTTKGWQIAALGKAVARQPGSLVYQRA